MISIVVPIYNGARFLDECVQSVLRQDSGEWELLLVDDGSTDATPQVCGKYLEDSRVLYFRKENSGVQETRWFGITHASSEHVTFLDADDILLPSTIGILHKYVNQCDVLSFAMQTFDTDKEIENAQPDVGISASINDRTSILKKILSGEILSCVWGGMYRRKMLLECGHLFCNGLKIGEDTMFNTEFVFSMSPRVAVLPLRLYCYRTNTNSVSHTYNRERHEAVYDTIVYLEKFLSRNHLSKKLRAEAGFRLLLLWSSFMFHPDNEFYHDKDIRKRMRKLYFPAFRYLYPYLKVYLFVDLFLLKLDRIWRNR